MAHTFGSTKAPTPIVYSIPSGFERIAGNPIQGLDYTLITPQDRQGHFINDATVSVNPVRNVSLTLLATDPDGTAFTANMGGSVTLNVPCWTGITGRYVNNDYARIELVGHLHGGATTDHLAAPVAVTLPLAGFGILACDALNGAIPDNIISVDYALAIQHIDKQNRVGNHLIGHSHGGRIDVTMTFIENAAPALAAGWYEDSNVLNDTNTDFVTRVIRCHKFFKPA